MAKDKNKIIVYADWIHRFEALTDEEAGKLIKHFFRYVNDLDPEYPDRITELSFIDIKCTLKRDLKEWEKFRERQSVNGSKGGRPKKPTETQKTQPFILKPKKAVTVTVRDSVTDSNINNPNVKIDFDGLLIFLNDNLSKSYRLINTSIQQKYKARLKEGYTKEDIFTSIKNASKDKFHIDNGFKHLTPEYFSRAKSLDLHSKVKQLSKREELQKKHNYKPLGA